MNLPLLTLFKKGALFAGLCLVLSSHPASATVKLPAIFSDNMVLQRDQPIAVWGWADPNETVSVTLGAESSKIQADGHGDWKVKLPALKQGEKLELTVAGQNSITLKNIVMG